MIKPIALALVVMMAFASPAQATTVGETVMVAAACFSEEDALEAASIGANDGREAVNAYFQQEGNSCQFSRGPVSVTIVAEIRDVKGKEAHLKVFKVKDSAGNEAWVLYKVPGQDA